MQFLGFSITRQKKIPAGLQSPPVRGWWRVLESFAGAWQQNVTVDTATVLTYSAVFACITLIASDVSKLCLRLMQQDDSGVWLETKSNAFSPVLRKPNHYQNIVKFIEQWIVAKLIHGNTYVLKVRDGRGIVVQMYILDSTKVRPLVAPDGSVFYELSGDDLSKVHPNGIIVPAREIIHDTMVALYHPLVGVSPLTACGLAATQGLTIQNSSSNFFLNGATPSGILTAPGNIPQARATELANYWNENFTGDNAGKVAVLGDGLKFEQMAVNAVDAQLIEQLKWTGETVCTAYHVPPYMIGIGPPPPYANVEPLLQQYFSQCIQSLTVNLERALDDGLGLLSPIEGIQYGTEFDIDDLIWMDSAARTTNAQRAISAGMSPNEVRVKYYGLPHVQGGDDPLVQQQNYSLRALARRDASDDPFGTPGAQRAGVDDVDADSVDSTDDDEAKELVTVEHLMLQTHQKAVPAEW